MEKDETLQGKFTIIDAISDSTFQNKRFHSFEKKKGFDKRKFKSLADVLNLPLADYITFSKENNAVYLIRCIHMKVEVFDEWTAAILKEDVPIPIMKYPSLLKYYVDPWLKRHKKVFSEYD